MKTHLIVDFFEMIFFTEMFVKIKTFIGGNT